MESLQILTDKYLRSMSPLAQRIGEDVDMTREAYQELWDTLNHEEQRQVLNEALIDPAAVLKYAKYTRNASDWNESAAAATTQFSWFTKSQLNLFSDPNLRNEKRKSPIKKTDSFSPIVAKNLVVDNIVIDSGSSSKARPQSSSSSLSESNNLLNKLKNKVTNLKIPSSGEEKRSLVENKIQISVVSKGPISKPKTPPPPPPVKHGSSFTEKKALLSTDSESDLGDDIPKTGFDFLDNW